MFQIVTTRLEKINLRVLFLAKHIVNLNVIRRVLHVGSIGSGHSGSQACTVLKPNLCYKQIMRPHNHKIIITNSTAPLMLKLFHY